MRKILIICSLACAIPIAVSAQDSRVFRWVDSDGVVHYSDSIPAEYAESPKDVLNDRGVTVENLEGKKTEEELAAEKAENERRVARELQKRADQALLATYLSVDEILMHRDRRVELFQAQSRVTELYLSNLNRRLDGIRQEASRYSPYSEDSDAPMIPSELAEELRRTKSTIDRHQNNLKKFQSDEQLIIARFDGDISRFKLLKGISDQ